MVPNNQLVNKEIKKEIKKYLDRGGFMLIYGKPIQYCKVKKKTYTPTSPKKHLHIIK